MLTEEGWPVVGQGQNTQTPTNTGRPVALALHPNFAPLRCAKLRPCPGTLFGNLGTGATIKAPRKKRIYSRIE